MLEADFRYKLAQAMDRCGANEQVFHNTIDYNRPVDPNNNSHQDFMRGWMAGIRHGLYAALRILDEDENRTPWWEE